MTESPEVQIVRGYLTPIYKYLLHPHVEEIAINRPGEIWQRLRKQDDKGRIWVPHEEPGLTSKFLRHLCHILANSQKIPNFGENGTPVIYGTIPGGHRFGAGIGWNIQYGAPDEYDASGSVCMCVRQFIKNSPVELESYGIQHNTVVKPMLKSVFTRANDPDDSYQMVINSLTRGDHILVSGATGTGKTTFLNKLVEFLDLRQRIITVEDTREIKAPQPNRVHVVMSRTEQANAFTYHQVRDLVVRMTPDIVLAGEISNNNAATVWDLMTGGHGHFMTTIHAESVKEAVTTFINCISNARTQSKNADGIDRGELRGQMLEKLRIIQVERDPLGIRRVTEIH